MLSLCKGGGYVFCGGSYYCLFCRWHSATIWAFGHTKNPYFVILGASLLFDGKLLMLLRHWGNGGFEISPNFTQFHLFSSLFTHFVLVVAAWSVIFAHYVCTSGMFVWDALTSRFSKPTRIPGCSAMYWSKDFDRSAKGVHDVHGFAPQNG